MLQAARGRLAPLPAIVTRAPLASPLPESYHSARFSGLGGSTVYDPAATPQPMLLNPVLAGLQAELDAAIAASREFLTLHADLEPHQLSRTQEGWDLAWRRWALTDLGDQVAGSQDVYVIHRGDSFQYRLFLDKQGQHLLGVQPFAPDSPLRYRKLGQGMDLADIYGPFARLSDTPNG